MGPAHDGRIASVSRAHRLLLLSWLAAYPIAGWSQAPSIGLEVKAIASGGRVRSWSGAATMVQDYAFDGTLTQDFWNTRARKSQVGLEIDIRNFRRQPQPVEVLALFFAKTVGSGETFLLSAEQAVFTLFNGEFTRMRMYSGVVRNSTGRALIRGINPDPYGSYPFIWFASETTEGTKLNGWIVQAMVNGRVLEVKTSGPTMENLARDRIAMAELMKPLQATQRVKPPE